MVINKIDKVETPRLLEVIDAYKDLADFKEIIPVSALKGENTNDLINTIFKYLEEGPMYFDEDMVTDQPERQIAAELIREKALRNLSDEIPHGIAVVIERMKERTKGNLIDIDASIVCERDSHKRIIIGKQGTMIKKIGMEARKDIEVMTGVKVNLKLWVKVRKDWRDSDIMMKNFGYNEKDI
jgi:GTP-binding protein Era